MSMHHVMMVVMVMVMRACHGRDGEGGNDDEGDETAHEMLPYVWPD
jgi:hypothetical protein